MSRGGGRGGRGGRFGGRGGPSSDLIRENIEDVGLDFAGFSSFNHDESNPPPVFPPIEVGAPLPLQQGDLYLINASHIMKERLKPSPYHLSKNKSVKHTVVKFMDIRKRALVSKASLTDTVLQNSGSDMQEVLKYVPYELIEGRASGLYRGNAAEKSASRRGKDVASLQRLEQAEGEGGEKGEGEAGKGEKKDGKGEDDDDDDEAAIDDDEFEGNDDYGVDHYASDGGDADGDDDGEATF